MEREAHRVVGSLACMRWRVVPRRRRHLPQIQSRCRRPSAAVVVLRLALREGEGVEKEEEARQPGLPRHQSPSLAHMAKVAAAALSPGHGTEVESKEKK
jgi:hypothetical protein